MSTEGVPHGCAGFGEWLNSENRVYYTSRQVDSAVWKTVIQSAGASCEDSYLS